MLKKPNFPLVSMILALLILLLVPVAVSAQGRVQTQGLGRVNSTSSVKSIQSVKNIQSIKSVATPAVSTTSGAQRACEARESAVSKRMTQMLRLGLKMLAVFQSHTERVQTYYLTKVLPAGLVVSNYDVLVADIAAKKALSQTALAKAQSDISAFNCTDGVARTYLNSFRLNMQAVTKALKNFRTSVKNLTVAVNRAAEGLEESEDEWESPQPPVSPTSKVLPSPGVTPTPFPSLSN